MSTADGAWLVPRCNPPRGARATVIAANLAGDVSTFGSVGLRLCFRSGSAVSVSPFVDCRHPSRRRTAPTARCWLGCLICRAVAPGSRCDAVCCHRTGISQGWVCTCRWSAFAINTGSLRITQNPQNANLSVPPQWQRRGLGVNSHARLPHSSRRYGSGCMLG